MGQQSTIDMDNDLDVRFGKAANNAPASYWAGLCLGVPSDDGLTYEEVTGAGYARVQIVNNSTNFPAAVNQRKTLGTVVTFPTPTGQWDGFDQLVLFDASTNGRARAWARVAGLPLVEAGTLLAVAAGSLTFTAAPSGV